MGELFFLTFLFDYEILRTMKKIIVDFKLLNDRIIDRGIPRAELARRLKMEPDTLIKFLKSGKKVKDHLILIDRICVELGFSWKDIIK